MGVCPDSAGSAGPGRALSGWLAGWLEDCWKACVEGERSAEARGGSVVLGFWVLGSGFWVWVRARVSSGGCVLRDKP